MALQLIMLEKKLFWLISCICLYKKKILNGHGNRYEFLARGSSDCGYIFILLP